MPIYKPYSKFGRTRNVILKISLNGQFIDIDENSTWDVDYWVERPEDEYGLMSSSFKNQYIRVIYREDWLRSKDC